MLFRDDNKSKHSNNIENFFELVKLATKLNMDIGAVVLKNTPGNQQIVASSIQKDLANAAAKETINLIIDDLEDNLFGILVDESSDISRKEQMAVVICYVDKMKIVKEHFIGIVHVANTCVTSLKAADRKSTRLNSSHSGESRMPSSA